jgi:hypothetical protein
MIDKEIEQIKKLKENLEHHKMSVLVGAGFSKNVSTVFPSWWELLYDMTYFLFKNEIEDTYEESLSRLKKGKAIDKKKFIENKVGYYINNIGYLDIVSEYIKRKGYQEAISTYIEEKTPKVIKEGNKQYLVNRLFEKDNKVELNEEMLSQHKALLNLPWNNIYTTNYDEMLERANDSLIIENIEKEIVDINIEIGNLLKEEEDINKKIESINSTNKDAWNQEKMQANNSLYRVQQLLKIKEKNKQLLIKAQIECLTPIINSSQLSIKRNKNIIKLHGTIRKDNSPYGFDNDIRTQYIIAREDYETYPVKHEAFTQLMRISLLQESYCLIGFSGVDTNFIEWIKWVRDILEKGKNRSGEQEYKIYFIDMDTNKIDADKLLFFENHRICRIPIMKNSILKFLETKTELKLHNKDSKKEAIELFLRFLSGGSTFNLPKNTFEILQQSKYDKHWESINTAHPDKININSIIKETDFIINLKNYRRIPFVNFSYSFNKKSFLFFSISIVEKEQEEVSKLKLLKLISIAFKDVFLPIRSVWDNDDFNKLYKLAIEDNNLKNDFDLFKLNQHCLDLNLKEFKSTLKTIPQNNSDDIAYYSILFSAFSFDFKKLKKQLADWKPNSHWVLKKVGLLALYDIDKAESVLLNHSKSSNELNQEQLYTLELLNYLKRSKNFEQNKMLYDKIQLYKNSGIKDINETLTNLINDVKKDHSKILPYGENRFKVSSNSFSMSNDFSDNQKSLQFLQILIESGFPISLPRINLKSTESVYPIFKLIFEYYPFPVLFYSIQYSEENILKRIGQDFAFSEALKDDLKKILPMLLKAYLSKETPIQFKKSILSFCSELFIAVDPSHWEKLFHQIWKNILFEKLAFSEMPLAEITFAKAAFPYIRDIVIIQNIISTTLRYSDSYMSSDYLYVLAENKMLEKNGLKIQSPALVKSIDELIKSLHKQENIWFIIGNLHMILSDAQKIKIKNVINALNFRGIKNERVWKVLIYFAENNSKTIQKIKKAILNNDKLWDAGFTDNGLSSKNSRIDISKLKKTKDRTNGIVWNKSEAETIFEKLNIEFFKIENFLIKRHEHNFKIILQEMLSFLESEKNNLKHLPKYNSIYNKIKKIFIKDRGYINLVDGILSSESSIVILALEELSEIIYENRKSNSLQFEISTLLNKVLLQSEPKLEECLNYVAVWVKNKKNLDIFKPYSNLLQLILKKYFEQERPEYHKPFVQKQLIEIANSLNEWGASDEFIGKWLEIKKNTWFNNIN